MKKDLVKIIEHNNLIHIHQIAFRQDKLISWIPKQKVIVFRYCRRYNGLNPYYTGDNRWHIWHKYNYALDPETIIARPTDL